MESHLFYSVWDVATRLPRTLSSQPSLPTSHLTELLITGPPGRGPSWTWTLACTGPRAHLREWPSIPVAWERLPALPGRQWSPRGFWPSEAQLGPGGHSGHWWAPTGRHHARWAAGKAPRGGTAERPEDGPVSEGLTPRAQVGAPWRGPAETCRPWAPSGRRVTAVRGGRRWDEASSVGEARRQGIGCGDAWPRWQGCPGPGGLRCRWGGSRGRLPGGKPELLRGSCRHLAAAWLGRSHRRRAFPAAAPEHQHTGPSSRGPGSPGLLQRLCGLLCSVGLCKPRETGLHDDGLGNVPEASIVTPAERALNLR